MGVDVFIVHGAPDKDTALRLREALVQIGVTAFVDKTDAPSAVPWDESIGRALRASLLQVVLLGDDTRWYQSEEIDIAIQEMRAHGASDRLVPVLLSWQSQQPLPYGLNRVQALRWDGPASVAATLAQKVAALRGGRLVGGTPVPAQRRIRVAVLGFCAELAEALETLRRRIGQRTAILEGEVQLVDLARDTVPEVDLRVALLGSRHTGKLALVEQLVAAARSEVATRTTLVGQIDVVVRLADPAYKAEARDMADLDAPIAGNAVASIIDQLDDQVAAWYATRFPSRPGMSITRERWEERYLEDKARLWRKGDPSALRSLGGARIDRVRWYVHLKAERPWVQVEREVRYAVDIAVFDMTAKDAPPGPAGAIWVRTSENTFKTFDTFEGDLSLDPSKPVNAPTHLWWSPNAIDTRDIERARDLPVFRHSGAASEPAWLDPILSNALLPRCVVVGSPGTGKTVLLQHLAWVLATTDEDPGMESGAVHRVDRAGVRGDGPTPPVPILHSATTLVAHLRGDRPIREALVALLRSSETFGDAADAAVVRAGIDAGRYVFLIDSLDEVPRRQDREAVVAALGSLTGPTPRVILTTRPSAHTAVELPDGFVRVDIAPLDEDATHRLTRAWIACWAPSEDLEQALRAVDTMRCDFPAQTDERSPVENPLLLGCVLQIYATYRRLPDDTAKLYHDMVRVLCEAKIHAADDRDRDTMVETYREALRVLALASQELGGTRLGVTAAHERLIEETLASRGTVESWLQALANHTGLVRFEGAGDQAVIRPWHRSYQEYLAAEAIALIYANRADDCVAWLREPRPGRGARLSDPTWQGTLCFLVGAAAHQNRAWGVNLIGGLMTAAATPRPDQARLCALATGGAAEYRATLFQNEALLQTLPEAVSGAFTRNGKDWPLGDRLDVLDALGRLGDPRLPDPRSDRGEPDPGWVEVPAGVYPVGAGDSALGLGGRSAGASAARTGAGKRRPRTKKTADHARALPRTNRACTGFWIRRWPVTVAEFLPFVDSVPNGPKPLFSDPRGIHGMVADLDWHECASELRAQARWPTRPVVHVTWSTARAFCAWAQHNWRLPCAGTIDLPTSAEWEIAARRDTDRVFPWGDRDPGAGHDAAAAYAWQSGSTDVVRSYTSATPVGAFPRGHSPEGIWDLGGNVFEWCASLHGGTVDHDIPIDRAVPDGGHGEMVYRGGCWSRSAEAMRVVRRGDCAPWLHTDAIGFRVVCRPANAKHD